MESSAFLIVLKTSRSKEIPSVIDIHEDLSSTNIVSKGIIENLLVYYRRTTKTKWHFEILIMALRGDKFGAVQAAFINRDLREPASHV